MPQVRGIGGVFFKSKNPESLNAWYARHLGIVASPENGGASLFKWRNADNPQREEMTVWSVFPAETEYFGSGRPPFMINYIVDDLDAALRDLRAAGVQVDERVERHDYGNFGWITDPDGNRIELWEPKTTTDPSPGD